MKTMSSGHWNGLRESHPEIVCFHLCPGFAKEDPGFREDAPIPATQPQPQKKSERRTVNHFEMVRLEDSTATYSSPNLKLDSAVNPRHFSLRLTLLWDIRKNRFAMVDDR
jgi:hypothetical protein